MSLKKKLLNWFYSLREPKVKWKNLKKDFIVRSNAYPHLKGWVRSSNEMVTATHLHPSVGQTVNTVQNDGTVTEHTIMLVKDLGNDTSWCFVEPDFPVKVRKNIALSPKNRQPIAIATQDGEFILARLENRNSSEYVSDFHKSGEGVRAGDSGLPWVLWEDGEFRVVSHNSRGGVIGKPKEKAPAYGPNYRRIERDMRL